MTAKHSTSPGPAARFRSIWPAPVPDPCNWAGALPTACCFRSVRSLPSCNMCWTISVSALKQVGRELEDIKLFMRLVCAVSADRDKVREQVKGYAGVAAYTTF